MRSLVMSSAVAVLAIAVAISMVLFFITLSTERSPRRTPPTDAKELRRRAKRENERVKLTATFLNGTGIAILLTTAIVPIFKTFGDHPEPFAPSQAFLGIGAASGLHLAGLWVLGLWRSEE